MLEAGRVIVAAAVLVVVGCNTQAGSPAPGSAAPQGSSAATAAPTTLPSTAPAPTTAPSPTAVPAETEAPTGSGFLAPGSAAVVAVKELNVREAPSTSSKRVATLKKGAIVIVSPYDGAWIGVGPVRKDGYAWYPVMTLQNKGPDGGLPPLPERPIPYATELDTFGWIAARDASKDYVTAVAARCPGTVDLVNVEGMLAAERLACLAGGSFVLEGTFGCDGCGGAFPGSFEPTWLATPESYHFLSVDPPAQFGPIALRFAPGGPELPALGSIIRVTLHVDDPAASSCRMSGLGSDGELVPIPDRTAVALCRQQLVVESYEIIGTDPDFLT
jgi:hypothetical protein